MRTATLYDFTINPENEHSAYYWQLRFLKGAGSVLEIGCSTGFFSRHLREQGSRVVGVELDQQAAEKARLVCERVICGDIESTAVQQQVGERFDAVLLGDVIEHLIEPAELLASIRREWLVPGGRVVLSIPNAGHWIFRREVLLGRFPYRQYGLFDRNHLRFYTRRSLLELVSKQGYQIEQMENSINPNMLEDITFAILKPLYRRPDLHKWLLQLESQLARGMPTLFAYQFILLLRPS